MFIRVKISSVVNESIGANHLTKDSKIIFNTTILLFLLSESFKDDELHKKWIELKKTRDICNISIEAKRASKEIGSSLEASLIINLNKTLFKISKNVDFSEICITSSALVHQSNTDETIIETIKAEGNKCPVCWKINKVKCERHSD